MTWLATAVCVFAIFTLIAVVVGMSWARSGMREEIRQAQLKVSGQSREIKLLEKQNRRLSAELKHLKETSQTLNQIKEKVFQINQRRLSLAKWAALPDRGGNWVNRINDYLRHTPLAGQGRTFYLAAVDAGIEPRLMPAIAMVESGGGRANANANNFFGRKAPRRGWMAWPTPEVAINNQGRYISKMWGRATNPYQMRGYATSPVWKGKVAREMARI